MILKSFETKLDTGLPLGNVTSQLFANIYLNELDQFIKHKLKIRYYIRYCDDFVILDEDKEVLEKYLKEINCFLISESLLELYSNKITFRKISQGIDFLGYIVFPHYIILRTKTKKRIIKKIKYSIQQYNDNQITRGILDSRISSYLGILTHCYGNKIKAEIFSILQRNPI